jgi:uncharacterized membrane protein YbhN (UPF0104 family)
VDSESPTSSAAAAPSSHRRRILLALLRIAVGFAILVVLLATTDLRDLGAALAGAQPLPVAVAMVTMLLVIVVSGIRWRIFVRAYGFDAPAWYLMRLQFVGAFFNAFLPTGVGGDAYKAIRLRGSGSFGPPVATVILDRVAGVVALGIIGCVAATIRLATRDTSSLVIIGGLLSVASILIPVLILGPGRGFIRRFGENRAGFLGTTARVVASMASVVRHGPVLRGALAAGLGTQLLILAAHAALARALDLDVSVAVLAVALVLATLAAGLPITINGLGVREATWVWSLGLYGITSAESLAYAVLILASYLLTSAVGGVVYVVRGGESSRRAAKDLSDATAGRSLRGQESAEGTRVHQ